MDDRTLTFDEFWDLPEKERGKRYKGLSDRDKFRVRLSMPPGTKVVLIPCNRCRYNHKDATCDAFPEGIDGDHMRKIVQEIDTPCGNGYRFVPIDEDE